MEIDIALHGDSAVITLAGTIDEQGAEDLKKAFASLELEGLREVTVDFHGVDYIGSSGIGKLLLFYKNLGVHGGRLAAVGLSDPIFELFRELKLDTIFSVQRA